MVCDRNIFTNYLLNSIGSNISNLTTNVNDNNDQYVIRFDTFIPTTNDNNNRNNNTLNDLSYNIVDVNYDNSYVLVDNNTSVSNLFNIYGYSPICSKCFSNTKRSRSHFCTS